MKLVLAEPRFLKDPVSIISELVNEVNFKINKDKLELIAMDPANVSMIIFNLLSSAFVEYEVDDEENISINLDNFKQILRRAKPSDTLILELDKEKNRLKVQLKGESTRTFKLSLIELDEEEKKIPELDFQVTVEVPTNVFDEAIEDMGVISESVALKIEKDNFVVESESRLNHARFEAPKGDEVVITNNKKDDVLSRYSLDYLKKICKGSKLAETVKLSFGNEYPLKTEYKVMDKLSLVTILAPRVSNE